MMPILEVKDKTNRKIYLTDERYLHIKKHPEMQNSLTMIEETKKIWMDGRFVDWKDAKIHILTHSLHYGAAVFEGIRFYKTTNCPAVFRLRDHVERLLDSAKLFDMKVPFSREEIEKAVIKLVRVNGIQSGYIRPIIYFGYGVMGLKPRDSPVNVAIALWPWKKYLDKEAIRVKTSKWRRISKQITNPNAKVTGHYVNSVLASMDAEKNGFDEALLLDMNGSVAEGPGENIFIVRRGMLITPPLESILPGITRDSVITLARGMGTVVEERFFNADELYNADEAFFTGTATEITPIGWVDERKIGNGRIGKITEKIKGAFEECILGKNKKYIEWLTFVRKKK